MRLFKQFEWDWLPDNLAPLKEEITRDESLWHVDQIRKNIIHHVNTDSIVLRTFDYNLKKEGMLTADIQEMKTYEISKNFPLTMNFLYKVVKELDGELSRALIARLRPGEKVLGHVDGPPSSYYNYSDRYHYVIHSKLGSPLYCGNEVVTMKEGELWWFENQTYHWADNPSDDYRTHLIFDVYPHNKICRRTLI